MRVLIIKTSSLGDVIHTLPALTDAARVFPGIRFDWVVEEAFAEIPSWHPAVQRVIPVSVRRWRKHPLKALDSGEWRAFRQAVSTTEYDVVIDAQGLLKSAWLGRYARSPVSGLDWQSAREPLASLFYSHRHAVPWGRHAVLRVRELFAQALGYSLPAEAGGERDGATDAGAGAYGLDHARVLATATHQPDTHAPYLVFLHGTTWATKHWPASYWRQLAERASAHGWQVRLPWGSLTEEERAKRIVAGIPGASVLPRLTLTDLAAELAEASACVAVDTGLGHLAAALDVPTLSLFGPTNPGFTGAWGRRQVHLAADFGCAPCLKKICDHTPTDDERTRFDLVTEQPLCFTRLAPPRVWAELEALLTQHDTHPRTPA
ncbi:MAG: lipopolysaccharide heptosyltransferase I [Azoarcus sp.]|nr:lipopolysaccharide heptosyltransferase I [Azoarcus sp.]